MALPCCRCRLLLPCRRRHRLGYRPSLAEEGPDAGGQRGLRLHEHYLGHRDKLCHSLLPGNGNRPIQGNLQGNRPRRNGLGNYLGEAAFDGEDGSDWFRLKGRQDLQYVISRKDGSYHLWEFFRFDLDKKYPFADVVKYVYNLSSADDISEIVVKPSLRDNTTAGKEIQKQIGVHSITDRATIERFYGLLTQVSLTDTTGIFDAGPESFKAERYLEIKTKDGRTIDPLKYEGIGGRFFEFGGLVYSPLSNADRAWLAQLFSINYDPAALQPTATPTPKP